MTLTLSRSYLHWLHCNNCRNAWRMPYPYCHCRQTKCNGPHWLKIFEWGLESTSPPVNTINPQLLVLANVPVVTAPSHMHLTDPPVLLRTAPAKLVNIRSSGSPGTEVVEAPNCKRQILQGDLVDTITSKKAEDKKTKEQMHLMSEMTMTP